MSAESPEVRIEAREDGPVAHRLEVTVGPARVHRAFERAYRDLARGARVRGFRPGKVPRSVLERLYGSSVGEQLQEALVAETLPEALEQQGIVPVAEPAVEAPRPVDGAEFRYSARVEVKPRVALPDTNGLPARRPRVEVRLEEVESELEALRQRNAPLVEEPEGTRAARGHVLAIDFVGEVDGQPFEGGSGKGVEVELGAGRFLPDFKSQLEGVAAGEDRELRVDFPADYANAQLAGRQAVFRVHVAELKRRAVPELDDEFAKDLGDFASLEALRERIRADLLAMRERASQAELQRSLLDALIERTTFEVPPGMVQRELSRQLHQARHRLEGHVEEEALQEQLARWQEEWRPRAERDVRAALLLEAVAEQEAIAVEPAEVEARIEEMARERGSTPARLRRGLREGALEAGVRIELRDQRVLARLAERAKVEETAHS
jgi:trigger factor